MIFLNRLFAGWGIEPIDWNITDKDVVKELAKEQPIPLSVCNDAAIALAFAVVKMRATCPPDIAQIGLHALERTAMAVRDSRLSSEVKAAWDESIAKMRAKLESFSHEGKKQHV